MTTNDLLEALARLRVETGSLACLGCGHEHNCSTHGYAILRAAADLIERLTAEVADLRKELEWKDMVIALSQKELAKAEAERGALIEQIKERHDCRDCKHNDFCDFDSYTFLDCMNCVLEVCPCAGCFDSSRWEWRGLPEAPEVE